MNNKEKISSDQSPEKNTKPSSNNSDFVKRVLASGVSINQGRYGKAMIESLRRQTK